MAKWLRSFFLIAKYQISILVRTIRLLFYGTYNSYNIEKVQTKMNLDDNCTKRIITIIDRHARHNLFYTITLYNIQI